MDATLTPSQIATLGHINERPGKTTVAAVGFEYAEVLRAAGYITIKNGRCHPTAKAAPFKGRTAAQQRADKVDAYAALIGHSGTLRCG